MIRATSRAGILLIVFGTETQPGTFALGVFEAGIRSRFPGIPVRWAFTSDRVRERLAGNGHRKSDSVGKALRRMAFERFTFAAVQPLHVVPGFEYEDVLAECARVGDVIDVAVGKPLLHHESDMQALAAALLGDLPPVIGAGDLVLFVGHGSNHPSTRLITTLGQALHRADPRVFTAVMKGGPTLEETLPLMAATGARKVWMLPLLAMVGRHMLVDLAGDRNDSWKSRINACGFCCEPVLHGMAESPACARIWASCLAEALRRRCVQPVFDT